MPEQPIHSCNHLPRLSRESYCATATVHWVMTVQDRAAGWLTHLAHAKFREALVHTLTRYNLLCPAYCLMPDHVHLIWMGCTEESDQKSAATFFRKITDPLLAPHRWQQQAYDHVLREDERRRGAFQSTCQYVIENPLRKNLCSEWESYRFSGALLPGFPDLDPRRADFWAVYWKIYNQRVAYVAPAR
jgi:putative transposase